MTGPKVEEAKEVKKQIVEAEKNLGEPLVLPSRPVTKIRVTGILAEAELLDSEGNVQQTRGVRRDRHKTGFENVPAAVTDWIISEVTKPQ